MEKINVQKDSLEEIFSNTDYRIINNSLYKQIAKKDNVTTKKLAKSR